MAFEATNINLLNAARSEMSDKYMRAVPFATPENIKDVYATLLDNDNLRNEIMPAIFNVVGRQTIDYGVYRNTLRGLKGQPMPFGETDMEIFVNFAEGIAHNPKASAEEIFGIYDSYIMAAYHHFNFNKDYPVTIYYDDIRTAFLSDYGLRNMVAAKVESVTSGANWDEYLNSKKLIDTAYKAGISYNVHIDDVVDKTTGDALLEKIQYYIMMGAFPLPELNFAGATSATKKEEFVFITTPEVMPKLNVQTLAAAFNLGKVDIDVQTIIVHSFENKGIKAALVNKRFFRIKDQYRTTTTDYAGLRLNYNHVYHVKESFSFSPFYQCFIFTTDSVDVTSLTPENVESYTAGSTVDINVTFNPSTAGTPMALRYEVSGNKSDNTFMIPGTNKLMIGNDEDSATITVKVTSAYKPEVTTNVTVSKGA